MSGRRRGLVAALAVGALCAATAVADPLADARRAGGWVSWVVPIAGHESPCCFTFGSLLPR